MPIKSFFLPNNALQGEEIPAYILWKDLNYDKILIRKFDCCNIIDIYNVSETEYSISGNLITINRVEVDGYVGLLLKTERMDEINVSEELSITFLKDEKVTDTVKGEIILFKPEIEKVHVPESIFVNNSIIDNKIMLQNIGEGTCRIVFKNNEKSEIVIGKPKRIKDFLEGYKNTFNEEVAKISSKYHGYEYVFEDIRFIVNMIFDPSDEVLLKEFKIRFERLEKAMEQDEQLAKDVLRAYTLAVFKNIHFITIVEQFLDFLESVQKNRIELLNALDTIEVDEQERKLILEIHYTDLLNSKIEPIILKPINISGNKKMDLSLYNIFNWNGGI